MTHSDGSIERRRTPRVSVSEADCRIVTRARVRLLDVSLSGALLASDVVLPTGSLGRLNTLLGGGPFAPVVEVLRNGSRRATDGRELGVQFQKMDDRSRRHLESFLTRAMA